MATFTNVYVSGGGSALKDALSNNFGDNVRFYLAPGIYDGGAIISGRNCSIIGEYGKTKETIIDGHRKEFCLKSMISWQSPISCHNITFRNGYCSDNSPEEKAKWAEYQNGYLLTGTWFSATKNATLFGCNVIDCVAEISALSNLAYGGLQERVDGGIVYPGNCYNCEISGCVSPLFLVHTQSPRGTCRGCDIHNNKQTAVDTWRDAWFVGSIYSSKFHHNEISGQGLEHGFNSLIYCNKGSGLSGSFLTERGTFLNCVFANNFDFAALDSSWGGSIKYINDVFYNNRISKYNNYGIIDCGAALTNDLDLKMMNCIFDESNLTNIFGNWMVKYVNLALNDPDRLYDLSNNTIKYDISGNPIRGGMNLSTIMISDNWYGIDYPGFKNAKQNDFTILSTSFIYEKTNYEDTMRKILDYKAVYPPGSDKPGQIKNLGIYSTMSAWYKQYIDKTYRSWNISGAFGTYDWKIDEQDKYLSLMFIY